jgi:hypothetical protein
MEIWGAAVPQCLYTSRHCGHTLNVIDNIEWKYGVLQFHSAYTRAATVATLNVIDNIKWKYGVLQFHSAYTRAATVATH